MAAWMLPPAAKVYEAFSAIADGRVHLREPGRAEVRSSGGDKTYTVEWSEDGESFGANDNASYWQGYLGYPIVAVLVELGRVHADPRVIRHFAGVDWHALNRRLRRDYDAAVAEVLATLAQRGVDTATVLAEAERVAAQLAALQLQRAKRSRRPPKAV
jgi:hypothetical protein